MNSSGLLEGNSTALGIGFRESCHLQDDSFSLRGFRLWLARLSYLDIQRSFKTTFRAEIDSRRERSPLELLPASCASAMFAYVKMQENLGKSIFGVLRCQRVLLRPSTTVSSSLYAAHSTCRCKAFSSEQFATRGCQLASIYYKFRSGRIT